MKSLDALTRFATVRLLTAGVGEEPPPAGAAAAVDPSPRPAGWDPFELWRAAVRDARANAKGPSGA